MGEDDFWASPGTTVLGNYYGGPSVNQDPNSQVTYAYFNATPETVPTQNEPFEFRALKATDWSQGQVRDQNWPYSFRQIPTDAESLIFDIALFVGGLAVGALAMWTYDGYH